MKARSLASRLIGLKALYAFSLLALSVYVVTGPANGGTVACSPYITSTWTMSSPLTLASGPGILSVLAPGSFDTSDAFNPALENVNLYCSGPTPCGTSFQFGFSGYNFNFSGLDFTIRLTGTSTGPYAYGTVYGAVQDADVTGTTNGTGNWTASGGALVMDPIRFSVVPGPGYDGFFNFRGSFNVFLGSGASVSWGTSSLDVAIRDSYDEAVPEPTSAVLLIGGFAVVEYLRRKSRRAVSP